MIGRFVDQAKPFDEREVQFLLAGYSWLLSDFQIWTIEYNAKQKRFVERTARSFSERLRKAAFIGDVAKDCRSRLARAIAGNGPDVSLEPLRVLSEMLLEADGAATIGGAPQVVRVGAHMNTRSFAVQWRGERTLFGRPLFSYEKVDYWTLDPLRGTISHPVLFEKTNGPMHRM